MSVQNKVAAGISALSGAMAVGDDVTLFRVAAGMATLTGAMAVGHDADAQIVNVTIPSNYTAIKPGGANYINNRFVTFGPANSVYFSFGSYGHKSGSTYQTYLRGAGPFGISFVAKSTNGVASSYLIGSVVSASAGAGFIWKAAPVLVSSFTLKSLTPGSGTYYEAFRFGTDATHFDYGWIGVKSITGTSSGSLQITAIAYAQNGNPITVGQTTDIPEPASASLLAMGAMALGARGVRRMKKAQAALKKAA